LGLIGIWRQYQSHRWELVLLAGIFLPTVVFYTNYNVADREMMVLPSYVVFALWIAVGWCEASDALPSLFEDARARAIAPALMLLLPLVALLVNYPLLDLSGEHGIREDGEQLLTQAEPNPVIASWWIDVAPLLYLQKVEGMRPDAELIFSSAGDKNYLLLMAQINVGHRPFYVRRDKEFLDERYDLVPIEGSSASGKSWYQVFEKGTTRAAGDD
jgi:hypothetical protein